MRTDDRIARFMLAPAACPLRHLLLQTVLLLITVNVFWDTPGEFVFMPERIAAWAVYYLMMNAMVYTNIYVLTPKLLLHNKFLSYLLGVTGLIIICLFTIGMLQSALTDDMPAPDENRGTIPVWLNLLSSFISVGLLVFGTSAVQLFRKWMADSLRAGELESATMQAELSFLKSQINPHFLFNMLNNVYVLIRKRRPEAAGIVFKLEDMLRYQIDDSARDDVLLSADIAFLTDYLNLEKIRRDKFGFSISQYGDIDGISVPPLMFIPFVENAVKHNLENDETTPYVNLDFTVAGNALMFRCENSRSDEVATTPEVGGIGLKNIRRRLELLYPGRHALEITETAKTYTVHLTLEL